MRFADATEVETLLRGALDDSASRDGLVLGYGQQHGPRGTARITRLTADSR